MTRFFSEVCLEPDGNGSLRPLGLAGAAVTEIAPSDSLREVYEQRGREEYAEPVVPDPALDRKFAVLVEEIAALLPVDSYLDAGCGDGRFLAALAGTGQVPTRVVGVDIAETILDTARRAAEHAGVSAELHRANLERLPLRRRRVRPRRLGAGARAPPRPGRRRAGAGTRPPSRRRAAALDRQRRGTCITRTLNAPRWIAASLLRKRHSRDPHPLSARELRPRPARPAPARRRPRGRADADLPLQRRRRVAAPAAPAEPHRRAPPRRRARRHPRRRCAPSERLAFRRNALRRHRRGRVHRVAAPPHAPRPRPRRRRLGRVHRLLRPGAEGGERPRAPGRAGRPRRGRLPLDGVDGVFHLAGQPGVLSFGGVFPVYVRQNVLASQRLFEAAAAAGARTVFASSSSIYGDAETYPTPEDAVPKPLSPYGITKLAAEQLAYAYGREFALDSVVLRYFTIFGPRQRPDMALTRMVARLLDGLPFELYGDGSQSRSLTYVDDAVEATILAMERGAAGATYNVGGGVEVTVRRVDHDAGEGLGQEARPGARRRGARATRGARPRTRRAFARTPAGSRAPRSRRGWKLSGAGPLIGSRPDERPPLGPGARRAGGRSLLSMAAHQVALVAADRRSRRSARCSASFSRSPAAASGARRRSSTSASRSRRSAAGRSRASRRTRGRWARSSAPSPSSRASREETGIPASKLRSSISTSEIAAPGQPRGINPLIEIARQGRRRAAEDRAGDGRARGARGRGRLGVRDRRRSSCSSSRSRSARRSSRRWGRGSRTRSGSRTR